ncbi:Protein of unknown function DUF3712 [Penicillium italicum]|uniref:Uncharacterized protein n=1 Tax=Penicillium italicum TaxID=40296 RepID=A0A0A2L0Y1_PENIT|nr:Protein of unknown function DUF3712 [Penicillium italicum]
MQYVVLQTETVLSVRGVTNSYLGVLKSRVTMDKDTMSPMLGHFKESSISDIGLIPAREDGTNLIGNAFLPNPSRLILDIGTLVLDVKSGDLVNGKRHRQRCHYQTK